MNNMRYCSFRWLRTSDWKETKQGNVWAYGAFEDGGIALLFKKLNDDNTVSPIAPTEKSIYDLGDPEIIDIYHKIDNDNKRTYGDRMKFYGKRIIKNVNWNMKDR